MWKIAFVCALIAALAAKTNCQFGFNVFNPQQNNQRQQAGFQPDFSFPQSDFVFPGFNYQQPFGFNQRPQQRPQNNFNQQRPQGNGGPKPTFAMKFTTARTTQPSFAPIGSSIGLGANRIESDERISQTSNTCCANRRQKT
jgi:hypothetical protein